MSGASSTGRKDDICKNAPMQRLLFYSLKAKLVHNRRDRPPKAA